MSWRKLWLTCGALEMRRKRKEEGCYTQRTRVIPGILLHTISIPERTLSETDKAAIPADLFEESVSLLKVPYSCKMHLTNVRVTGIIHIF